MGERRGKVIHHVIVPIAVLVVVAMSAVLGFIWFSAKTQDHVALRQSVEAVRDAIDRKLARVGLLAVDYTWWNEAVRNLDLTLNENWADHNVGFYIHDVHGMELSLVIDRDGETIYEQLDGARAPEIDAFQVLTPELWTLVEQARAAPLEAPEPATGLLPFGDHVAFVGVSAVTPQEESNITIPEGRVVLVYAKKITQDLLDKIAEPLPLADLRLLPPDVATDSEAVIPLSTSNGNALGHLVWTPHQPGNEFLRSVAPSLAVAMTVVLAFTWVVLSHARQTARAIEASEARFRDVADASSDWIWETDSALRVNFLSERFAAVTGTSPGRSLGRPLAELLHTGESADRWEAYLEDLRQRRPFRNVLCLYEDADRRTRTVRVAGKPILDERGRFRGYRGTATDITVEIEAERRAQHLALHDPLTGLPNRELLGEQLEQVVASVGRRGDMAAVLCLDLDRFKEVNDTLGHSAGDLLLTRCGERLGACVREIDTVARIGGDEFAVVQASCSDATGVQQLCRRVLDALQVPFDLDGHEVMVTASIGVALVPLDGSIPGKLIQNADIALYRAKEEGRNTFRFFEHDMDARLQQRKALERDLRLALARDELELYYQPKVSLARGDALCGVEALVRWNHPERGLVPPNDFIGVAEETGLILPLGEWVLRTACKQAGAWSGLHLSVNISPVQFKQRNLIEMVRDALAESGIEPHRLELEITESVLIQHTDAALVTLRELKDLGVHIAMDDFGTGYSSLSYLQRFPFDKIKIDKSFIRGLDSQADADAIVRAVVSLGRSLGMETCAEGVETAEQLTILKAEGCSEVQGFYFGRPMKVADFQHLYGTLQPGRRMVPLAQSKAEAVAS